MFKEINCEQGTDEWLKARLGNWTASNFSKLITLKGKLSTQAETQNSKLVAERILQVKEENGFTSDAMLRGQELEDEAFNFLNFTQGYEFKKVGFLDSGKGYGCSPDALDYDKKMGLELKCPMSHTHLQYLLKNEIPSVYYAQVQGSMLVSGFDKWIFCSYHPTLKSMILEIKRDEKFIDSLKELLTKNCEIISEQEKKLREILGD